MSGITLVFTICSVIMAGAHFALVNGAAGPDRPVNPYPLNPEPKIGVQDKCYSCKGCATVDSSTKIEHCPVIKDYIPGCVSYSEINLHNVTGDEWVVRGCATTLRSCEEIRKNKNIGLLLSCTQCAGDYCNYN